MLIDQNVRILVKFSYLLTEVIQLPTFKYPSNVMLVNMFIVLRTLPSP